LSRKLVAATPSLRRLSARFGYLPARDIHLVMGAPEVRQTSETLLSRE
jgi:hypothetical protein